MKRENTKKIEVGNIIIGGNEDVVIQSMCDIKTSKKDLVIKEINECSFLGAQLMRISILDEDDLNSIKYIKEAINVPLVADIHYDYRLAIKSIENGIDKIRINPGNITNKDDLIKIIDVAKKYCVPIRIGVNEGSLLNDNSNLKTSDKLVSKAVEYIHFFESNKFYDLVLSLKTTNPLETIDAYRKISSLTNYPLHIGLTESGFEEIGIIRSVATLSPLLLEGIGDTIRISLTNNPQKEVLTAKRLLHDLNLYPNYPTIISCPTCGRCEVKIKELATKTLKYLEDNKINLKVAIMGCPVNGIGEGKNADIGIAGGNKQFILFKKGKVIKKVNQDNAFNELIEEINKLWTIISN